MTYHRPTAEFAAEIGHLHVYAIEWRAYPPKGTAPRVHTPDCGPGRDFAAGRDPHDAVLRTLTERWPGKSPRSIACRAARFTLHVCLEAP